MPIHLPKPGDRAGESQTGIAKQPGHASEQLSGTVVDRRPAAAVSSALRQLADNSRPVAEGQALQTMVNNSPRVRKAPAFQCMVNSGVRMNPQPQSAAAIPAQLRPNGVVQLVAQSTYKTTGKANLRSEANIKNVIAAVPAGEHVTVGERAKTQKWRKLVRSKDHTLVNWNGRTGWLKDEVLGSPATAPVASVPRSSVPAATAASTPSSRPISIGGAARVKLESISIDELRSVRENPFKLSSGKAEAGHEPKGLGQPDKEVGTPGEYQISIKNGVLYSSNENPLNVATQPFVLSTENTLYGGPRKVTELGGVYGDMPNHRAAQILSPAWAGMLTAIDGKVTEIDNNSGTYMLSNAANAQLVKFLYQRRVLEEEDLEALRVYYAIPEHEQIDRSKYRTRYRLVTGGTDSRGSRALGEEKYDIASSSTSP